VRKRFKVVIYYGVDDRGKYRGRKRVDKFNSYEEAEAYAESRMRRKDMAYNVSVYWAVQRLDYYNCNTVGWEEETE